jgi:thioredoxin 1
MRLPAAIITLSLCTLLASAQMTEINHVSAVQFDSLLQHQAGILLDVRTLREYQNGHIAHAGNLNFYAPDFADQLLLLSKKDVIYLYCNVGHRSLRAAHVLANNGYPKVVDLRRGILEWNRENLPVVVSPDAKPDLENLMTVEEYNALIAGDDLVFIDYYAPWCAPCRKMMPLIDSLAAEYNGRVNIVKINTDASKDLIKALGILGIPYFVLYRKNQLLFSHSGVLARKELVSLFQKHIK